MIGPRQVAQGALFYEFSIEGFVAPGSPGSWYRPVPRSVSCAVSAGTFLQVGRPPVDQSRTHDPHVAAGLLHGHAVRAAALRRGPCPSGVSVVLQARSDRCGARSFDIFQEPPRPLSRERPVPESVRDRAATLHG